MVQACHKKRRALYSKESGVNKSTRKMKEGKA